MKSPRLSRARFGAALGAAVIALTAATGCNAHEQNAFKAAYDAQVAQARSIGGLSDAQLERLRDCESSGNYNAVSSSGRYRGAYQFSQATWNNVAEKYFPAYVGTDPASAPAHIQDGMARGLYLMAGKGQWPHCGRHL